LPLLALVDPERVEPCVQVFGDSRRSFVLVGEDEHAHAPRLAVPDRLEADRACGGCDGASRLHDPVEFDHGPMAEERERDVQVAACDGAAPIDVRSLPRAKGVENPIRESESAEEP
jgi:hypothetical protein